MKKFWFFDLDGTLADTDADIRLAWKGAMSDLGLQCPSFDERFVAGPPIEEMARILFPGSYTDGLGISLRAAFGRRYDTDGFPLTCEYPGVLDAVRKLALGGARVFIVTNKRYVGAKALALKFGWDSVFEGIYAGDMYQDDPSVGKLRKGALLARLMRSLGASPADCVMVGDTSNDFIAARENDISSIGVAWGYGKPEELDMADSVIHVPAELTAD